MRLRPGWTRFARAGSRRAKYTGKTRGPLAYRPRAHVTSWGTRLPASRLLPQLAAPLEAVSAAHAPDGVALGQVEITRGVGAEEVDDRVTAGDRLGRVVRLVARGGAGGA